MREIKKWFSFILKCNSCINHIPTHLERMHGSCIRDSDDKAIQACPKKLFFHFKGRYQDYCLDMLSFNLYALTTLDIKRFIL